MYKISELIGKRAITLVDAKTRGIVLGAYFDKNLTRLKCFSLLEEGDESTFFVDYKGFSSLLGDAAVVRSPDDLCTSLAPSAVDSPINLPAFNQDGVFLGIIRDITVEDAAVLSFLTDNGEIAAGTVLSHSDKAAVFNDTGKPIKLRPVRRRLDSDESRSSLDPAADADAAGGVGGGAGGGFAGGGAVGGFVGGGGGVGASGIDAASVGMPFRAFGEGVTNPLAKYSFLLGKRLQRSVYAKDGTLVARENELVTEKIIRLAKENSMLVAIALHSL